MRITFLAPGYVWGPSGGMRVVYEYANRLVARGHEAIVVHPWRLKYPPPSPRLPLQRWLRERVKGGLAKMGPKPSVTWHPIDERTELRFVPDSGTAHLPDSDVIFGTSWHTVRSVLEAAEEKGEKCYLIQGYESYHAAKPDVDATWRAPLHKVVIAKWMLDLGRELGCDDLTYIPNAINHERFLITQPIERRSRQVAMLFSTAPIKGAVDGIEALQIVRAKYPDLTVVFFGVSRAQSWIPDWATYYRNPSQDFLVNEVYNKSSIFLAPSWTEGSPLPPVEAAACGCAVVATDIGGFREYIRHDVTGLLSPAKDPQGLADSMWRLLGDEGLRVRLATEANRVVRTLDWERSTDLLESFIRRVAARRHSKPNAASAPRVLVPGGGVAKDS